MKIDDNNGQRRDIMFGADMPTLWQQLNNRPGVTLTMANVMKWQRQADAVSELYDAGLISPGCARNARRKIYQQIYPPVK